MPSLVEALESLLAEADFVHLMVIPMDDGDSPHYRASYRRAGQIVTRVAPSFTDLANALVAERCSKRCSRCGEVKPWAEFPKAPVKPSRAEGRHHHCKLCDRKRKLKYNRRRPVALAPAPPAPDGQEAPQSPPGN